MYCGLILCCKKRLSSCIHLMYLIAFSSFSSFFFFNDTATTEIYTLSLHDALPISGELSDATVALDWLQSVNPEARQCWIAGYSFGA